MPHGKYSFKGRLGARGGQDRREAGALQVPWSGFHNEGPSRHDGDVETKYDGDVETNMETLPRGWRT